MAAIRFNVSESSKFSPLFLLYNRDVVLPGDNILQPRKKYVGEEYHQIALQEQHKNSSMIKSVTVSAVSSGTAKASGQPLYQSKKAMIYLFPDRLIGYGPGRSKLSFAIGYGGISVSCNGGLSSVKTLSDK